MVGGTYLGGAPPGPAFGAGMFQFEFTGCLLVLDEAVEEVFDEVEEVVEAVEEVVGAVEEVVGTSDDEEMDDVKVGG